MENPSRWWSYRQRWPKSTSAKLFFCGAKIRKNIGGPRLNVRVLATRIRSTRTGIWLTPSPRCLHASRTESWSVTRTPNLLIFQGIRGGGEREWRGGYAVLRLLTLLANYENICAAHLAIGCGCCRDESPIHPDPRCQAKGRGTWHVLGQFKNLSCVIHESAVGAWCKCLWAAIRF